MSYDSDRAEIESLVWSIEQLLDRPNEWKYDFYWKHESGLELSVFSNFFSVKGPNEVPSGRFTKNESERICAKVAKLAATKNAEKLSAWIKPEQPVSKAVSVAPVGEPKPLPPVNPWPWSSFP